MKTISLTLDDDILQAVDTMTTALNMTRSAFLQYAAQLALQHYNIKKLEEKHQQGYLRKPVVEGEFSDWEEEQEWGDG